MRFLPLLLLATWVACQAPPPAPAPTPTFSPVQIVDSARFWWARVPQDFNGDGLMDFALQHNNAYGGWLGWYEAQAGGQAWTFHPIAAAAPDGQTFAGGDLDAADIDGDGDIDLIGLAHPGEWDSAQAPTQLYWYANPGWEPTPIGQAPNFVKDLNLADLNGDQRPDLVTITFETHHLTLFRQDRPDQWTEVLSLTLPHLHEGMDVGDIDGDGDLDLVPNGYWLENPGGDMTGEWIRHRIDDRWHSQEGDWSRDATKVACADFDGDGRAEVLISHSERAGYPLALYHSYDPATDQWQVTTLAGDFPACHTLQTGDFDADGRLDVLAGMNTNRAKALDQTRFPVILFRNQGDWAFQPDTLSTDGIYNGQVTDLEGDGDADFFRFPTHDDSLFYIWINQVK